jgi:hypothetical protein
MKPMEHIDRLFENLESKNDTIRYTAFKELSELTEHKVQWIYDKWYILTEKLSSENSFQRNIGLKLLANLCKSDAENRIGTILDQYLEHFHDIKFITSRQCIQNVWKIALNHAGNREKIIRQLENSYYDNIYLKRHGNLIKQDIIGSLFMIYQNIHDEELLFKIKELIDSEIEDKIRASLQKIVNG